MESDIEERHRSCSDWNRYVDIVWRFGWRDPSEAEEHGFALFSALPNVAWCGRQKSSAVVYVGLVVRAVEFEPSSFVVSKSVCAHQGTTDV